MLRTYHELVDFVVDAAARRHLAPAGDDAGTINAFIRRLLSSQRALGAPGPRRHPAAGSATPSAPPTRR